LLSDFRLESQFFKHWFFGDTVRERGFNGERQHSKTGCLKHSVNAELVPLRDSSTKSVDSFVQIPNLMDQRSQKIFGGCRGATP